MSVRKKELNGLKQSYQAGIEWFSLMILKYGTKSCQANHTLFFRGSNDKITAFIVDIDDVVVTGMMEEKIKHLTLYLGKEIEMKELGC